MLNSKSRAGVAQLARASAFQAEGRGFEARLPLHFLSGKTFTQRHFYGPGKTLALLSPTLSPTKCRFLPLIAVPPKCWTRWKRRVGGDRRFQVHRGACRPHRRRPHPQPTPDDGKRSPEDPPYLPQTIAKIAPHTPHKRADKKDSGHSMASPTPITHFSDNVSLVCRRNNCRSLFYSDNEFLYVELI